MTQNLKHFACKNAGLGLRTQHITQILNGDVADSTWFELLADNWLTDGGLTGYYLDALSERFPLSLHGVGLSIGGPQALDFEYLSKIKHLMQRSQALWYSEHLCFCQTSAEHVAHDLLPLPYTEESIQHLVPRIKQVQDFMGEAIMIENVSSYIQYKTSEMSEAEFLKSIAEATGCKILLDVNNIYVSAYNQHAAEADNLALNYLHQLKTCYIGEMHLAGFEDKQTHLIDAHNNPVSQAVWQLYESALNIFGPTPTLVEWDNNLPEYSALVAQRQLAQTLLDKHIMSTSTEKALSNNDIY